MAELEEWVAAAGLEVRVDAVGSRFGRLAGGSKGRIRWWAIRLNSGGRLEPSLRG